MENLTENALKYGDGRPFAKNQPMKSMMEARVRLVPGNLRMY